MRAGRLDQRVTLQRMSNSQDGPGQDIQKYTDVRTVWAAVESLRGDEFFSAQKFSSEVTHRVVIRRFPGLDGTWHVKWGRRILGIVSAPDAGTRSPSMELICRELTTGEPV